MKESNTNDGEYREWRFYKGRWQYYEFVKNKGRTWWVGTKLLEISEVDYRPGHWVVWMSPRSGRWVVWMGGAPHSSLCGRTFNIQAANAGNAKVQAVALLRLLGRQE